MKNLIISSDILEKLTSKHDVTRAEVEESFMNRDGPDLVDIREEHRTDPPTEWFISETDAGRKMKVAFVFNNGNVYLKSAFPADEAAIALYKRLSK